MKLIRTAVVAAALLCSVNAQAGPVIGETVKGSTDYSVTLRIIDATTGVPSTDLTFESSGIDLWYRREGAASVDITEVTLAALTTAHTDGGFLHINDGEYRLDLPDAAVASGADFVDVGGAITGEIVIGGRVELSSVNMDDAVRGGMTALPNANAQAAGGLFTRGTGAGQINQAANGQIDTRVVMLDEDTATIDIDGTATGAAASVTGAVTVGTNSDKTGYSLSTAGVNAVLLGQGIPAPTTIASLSSQTSFTLTAGSADDNAYNGYGIIIRDASTATQQALGCVRDYTGSTRTVTLLEDPAIFTMATSDNVTLLPAYCDAQVIADLLETALLICTVDTANFAGDSNDFACDLTDRAGVAVTSNMADGDLSGLEVVVLTGAQQYEKRFISATTDWDGANSEMRLNLSRALPAALADGVTVIIR